MLQTDGWCESEGCERKRERERTSTTTTKTSKTIREREL